MENENIEKLFEGLRGQFNLEEPDKGHQDRFLDKLKAPENALKTHSRKKGPIWKPLGIAASILVILAVATGKFSTTSSIEEQVAEISPEVANNQFYFASLVEEQVKLLEQETGPETKEIIEDTMQQLKKLETDYKQLEQELINGGNSKFLLSAMITNFRTRIDLLEDVLDRIETIKNFKNYHNEKLTI